MESLIQSFSVYIADWYITKSSAKLYYLDQQYNENEFYVLEAIGESFTKISILNISFIFFSNKRNIVKCLDTKKKCLNKVWCTDNIYRMIK